MKKIPMEMVYKLMQGTTCKFTIEIWHYLSRDSNRFKLTIKFNHFIHLITPQILIFNWFNRLKI